MKRKVKEVRVTPIRGLQIEGRLLERTLVLGSRFYEIGWSVPFLDAFISPVSPSGGEWPSGPASSISLTEVKHGCVRSETGWATFQMNDQNSSLSRPSEGTLN